MPRKAKAEQAKETKPKKLTKKPRSRKNVLPISSMPLFDMAVVQRFHALELRVLEYEKSLRKLAAKLKQQSAAHNERYLVDWFVLGGEVNQRFNFLSELIDTAVAAHTLPEEQLHSLRGRCRVARDEFYKTLYHYYSELFKTVRALAHAVAVETNPFFQEYFELIHFALAGLTPTSIETVILKKRAVEHFLNSTHWLGKYRVEVPSEMLRQMTRHEKEIKAAITAYPKLADILATFADDLQLSNGERESINQALGTELRLLGK